MKITNLFNATNLYNKNIKNDKKIEKQEKKNDTLVVSNQARDFQTVLRAVANSPDAREEKVNNILDKMKNESYNVSTEDIAKKLLSKY